MSSTYFMKSAREGEIEWESKYREVSLVHLNWARHVSTWIFLKHVGKCKQGSITGTQHTAHCKKETILLGIVAVLW